MSQQLRILAVVFVFIITVFLIFVTRPVQVPTQCPIAKDALSKEVNDAHAGELLNILACGGDGDITETTAVDKLVRESHSKPVVIFVSCNWYDRHKLQALAMLAERLPDAFVVLTGGLGRLSSSTAHQLGGEALELRELIKAHTSIRLDRLAIMTGIRTTGDNVDFLLAFIKSRYAPNGLTNMATAVSVLAIEESYLIRRLRSTLLGRLNRNSKYRSLVSDVVVVPSGVSQEGELGIPRPFLELAARHHNAHCVVAYLLVEEVNRLQLYSDKNNSPFLFAPTVAFPNAVEHQRVLQLAQELTEACGLFFETVKKLKSSSPEVSLSCLAPN